MSSDLDLMRKRRDTAIARLALAGVVVARHCSGGFTVHWKNWVSDIPDVTALEDLAHRFERHLSRQAVQAEIGLE